ncbi:MAG: hypothetical protein LBE08_01195 [Bifidobacteriaceae bacterium]|jgi:hypothetical protein|nr:hypothetical protein [Bifidobacteriaceae bacterium]
MSALIVTESYFGNTAALGEAIAGALAGPGGMAVELRGVEDAPATLPGAVDLLVLAAPTHNYSLPRSATRSRARSRGAKTSAQTGLREWIATLSPQAGLKVVTVDTALHTSFMPSSAAKTAARLLRQAGFTAARRGATFFVADTSGPLDDGESARARAWATALATGIKAPNSGLASS